MNHRRILSQIALVAGTLLFSVGLQTFAAFTPPTTTPPAADAYAPLNTSPTAQAKTGGLLLNTGGATNGLIVQSGKVGIGTASPSQELSVDGIIQSMSGGIKFPDGTVQTTAAGGAGAETDPTVKSWAKTDNPTIPGNMQVDGTIRGATYGFGGMYSLPFDEPCGGTFGPPQVGQTGVNPFTGNCSCPSGFNDVLIDPSQRVHMCYR